MSNLSVCCVMLVNGRFAMVERAIRSFQAQTLPTNQRYLLMFDNGEPPFPWDRVEQIREQSRNIGLVVHHRESTDPVPIGTLRNVANGVALRSWDCVAHWDSDDWSHPQRLMEQVALLETTGVDCVGYNDLLFWRSVQLSEKDVYGEQGADTPCDVAEDAWLWSEADNRKPIGTSLCYRRKAWERVPFQAMPNRSGATSEYYHWLKAVTALGVTSLPKFHGEVEQRPRMIASIHGANTQYYDPADYVAHNRGTSWRRAAEWDKMCSGVMAL